MNHGFARPRWCVIVCQCVQADAPSRESKTMFQLTLLRAVAQKSKWRKSQDNTASERRTLRWAMGQERQWPWSIGSSCHLLAHTCTGRCNGAPSQTSKTSHDKDAMTRQDGRALRWGTMGQESQWPLSTSSSRQNSGVALTARSVEDETRNAELRWGWVSGSFARLVVD